MSLVMLDSQATIPGAKLPAPENRTCPLPKWLYPADSPCSKQDAVFQNSDVFNIKEGVIKPAQTIGAAIGSIGKWVVFGLALYVGLNIYALVKR